MVKIILNKLKNNYIVKKIYFFPKYFKWKKLANLQKNSFINRLEGYNDIKYQKIKLLKNKHLGQKCFIVATGPSLTFEDLKLLHDKNIICFGVNSIVKILDQTEWRPTYYGIQDSNVFRKLNNDIIKYKDKLNIILLTNELALLDNRFKDEVLFPYISYYHYYDSYFDKYYSMFSDNSYAGVFDGYTITYSMIQIAVYMGFNEIYLIGVDCNYTDEKKYFIESGYIDRNAKKNYDKMVTSYKVARDYAEKHNVKIFNATRGGKLEVFERINFDDIIKKI